MKKTGINIILFFLIEQIFEVGLFANSQDFIHFTNESGLSNNCITNICQDQNGFLWIGTNDGLNRFDGSNFKVYRNNTADINSIPSNDIAVLFVDSKKVLWIGTTNGGVCYYNPLKNNFVRLGNKTTINDGKNLSNLYITGISEDKKGNIWISTYGGLNKVRRTDGRIYQYNAVFPLNLVSSYINKNKNSFPGDFEKFVHSLFDKTNLVDKCFLRDTCISKYGIEKSIAITENLTNNLYNNLNNTSLDNQITSMYLDDNGKLWLGYLYSGFSCFDPEKETYKHCPFIKEEKKFPASYVTSFYKQNNYMYVGYEWGAIEVLDIDQFKVTERIIDHENVNHLKQIQPLHENDLWLVSGCKLVIYNILNKSFNDYANYFSYKNPPIDNSLNYLFRDMQNNTWLGSKVAGLYMVHENKNFIDISSSNYLSTDWMGPIFQDRQKNFWVGYYSGNMDKFNNGWKNRRTYSYKSGITGSFATESVNCIFQDCDGNIWVSNYQGGLQLYNPKNDNFITFKHQNNNENSISSNDIRWITEDKNKNLWLATQGGGLCKFSRITQKCKKYNVDYTDWQNSLASDWLTDIEIDSTGLIWIGSSDGFSIYDTVIHSFRSFRTENSNLPHNSINDIYIDSYSNVWLGTAGGLCVYEQSTGDIFSFTRENGLPNNDIKSIMQDNKGRIWASSGLGIFSFSAYINGVLNTYLISQTFKKYDISDGISSNEFCVRSCFKTNNGMFLFGGRNGITAFYPDSIEQNTIPPPILFTNLKVSNSQIEIGKEYDGQVILKKAINCTDTITLNYKHNVVTFEFVALNFVQTNKNQYRYRLVGFDSKWQYLGNRHEVTYTNLDPGHYRLDVMASNNDGVWNTSGKSLFIIIKPPFWGTLWFRMLMVIIVLGAFVSYYYIRLTQIEKRSALLQNLVDERTKEIKEKNEILIKQKEELYESNILLEGNKRLIEEQTEKLKIQRDELSQLNATKDKLFSILAHDLRGPFNAILGFSELLVRNVQKYPREKIEAQVTTIRDVSRYTYELLENLLHWSRSQRGIIEFEPRLLRISELVEDDLKMLRQQALRKEILINVDVEGEEKPYNVDPNMLSAVIRNLTSNAIKYSNKGDNIGITLAYNNGTFRFSIADNGIGIPENQKDKLFDIKDYNTRLGTSGEKGTGLGLLLCQDFIHRHGGKIWVESEENKGSTFAFTIPFHN